MEIIGTKIGLETMKKWRNPKIPQPISIEVIELFGKAIKIHVPSPGSLKSSSAKFTKKLKDKQK